ncbi:AAA family ATPase [Cucumibacter marinus]|uniref:AAA family ATPase n=1 Tax=Cucumibacter marinus TaxID=1121252 RepID=UPI00040BCE26|nr:AAA family ATPase [Cucumibacter marinus]
MLHTLAISGYRSIRDLVLPLDRLTLVTGRNGTGKSSFYRALRLLAEVAQGRVIASLAAEGGLTSTLWAGPEKFSRALKQGEAPVEGLRRKDSVSLKLGFASEDYGYAIDLGMPKPPAGAFMLDPEIKAEAVWAGDVLSRRNVFASRAGPSVTALDPRGYREVITATMPPFESMMMHAADPKGLPELLHLRERMRSWRFYDHFRTDAEAPARRTRVGTRTPMLSADGGDLPAALQTIREIGDPDGLNAAIEDAFPGASLEVRSDNGRFELLMGQHGLLRALGPAELSDGTLRYLLLVAALLTPRPPELIVLNEPETSLHPDLLAPLARLIARAAKECQLVVVTHDDALKQALLAEDALHHELVKELGETLVPGAEELSWTWPSR